MYILEEDSQKVLQVRQEITNGDKRLEETPGLQVVNAESCTEWNPCNPSSQGGQFPWP